MAKKQQYPQVEEADSPDMRSKMSQTQSTRLLFDFVFQSFNNQQEKLMGYTSNTSLKTINTKYRVQIFKQI